MPPAGRSGPGSLHRGTTQHGAICCRDRRFDYTSPSPLPDPVARNGDLRGSRSARGELLHPARTVARLSRQIVPFSGQPQGRPGGHGAQFGRNPGIAGAKRWRPREPPAGSHPAVAGPGQRSLGSRGAAGAASGDRGNRGLPGQDSRPAPAHHRPVPNRDPHAAPTHRHPGNRGVDRRNEPALRPRRNGRTGARRAAALLHPDGEVKRLPAG